MRNFADLPPGQRRRGERVAAMIAGAIKSVYPTYHAADRKLVAKVFVQHLRDQQFQLKQFDNDNGEAALSAILMLLPKTTSADPLNKVWRWTLYQARRKLVHA